jgi:putative hydrolase of HD superfamily
MSFDRFKKQLDFIIEIDKVKQVLRNTILMDTSRRENDAEQ